MEKDETAPCEFKPFHFKCVNVDYTLLVVPAGGVRLYGTFGLKVIFGCVEANGFVYAGKRFNASQFVAVSIPVYQLPLFLNNVSVAASDGASDALLATLTSRLRNLVDQPSELALQILTADPASVVMVLHHKRDESSSFIAQQHPESIFGSPQGANVIALSDLCFCLRNDDQPASFSGASYVYSQEECHFVWRIRERLEEMFTTHTKHNNRALLIGNKGSGKSTLMRYLVNLTLSRTDVFIKKIYLLDCDVGQSELTPPGLISLHEITEPLLSATFAQQRLTLTESFFYGAITPSADFGLYIRLVERCLRRFQAIAPPDAILFVNTVGWIEELGYDLMTNLIHTVCPSLLVNVTREATINFEVPANFRHITSTFRRNTPNLEERLAHKTTPALLRSFLTAGYFGACFANAHLFLSRVGANADRRLADLRPYTVKFDAVALYFHPELASVADRVVFCALNCAVVALCSVDADDNENFDRRRVKDDMNMPERLTAKILTADARPSDADARLPCAQLLELKRPTALPVLRCHGYGFVRAIDLARRLFYVLTPSDTTTLPAVNVFALGYETQTPKILYDLRSTVPAPYVAQVDDRLTRNQQKLFSPLRNITGGGKRMIAGDQPATSRPYPRSPPHRHKKNATHRH